MATVKNSPAQIFAMATRASEFLEGAKTATGALDRFVSENRLRGMLRPDNINYRCSTSEEYKSLSLVFGNGSVRWRRQQLVGGRNILSMRLAEPLQTETGPIGFLKLSEPKPGVMMPAGFDHIEVLPMGDYDQLIASVRALGHEVVHVQKPHHTTDNLQLDGLLLKFSRYWLAERVYSSLRQNDGDNVLG